LILKMVISGLAIKTLLLPPNLGILASISPNALDIYQEKLLQSQLKILFTARPPGKIL